MATLSLTVFKAKQLANGKHKIRIAVRHHHETSYIITPYIIDDISQFKNGNVIKRYDADVMNVQLRTLMNKYAELIERCGKYFIEFSKGDVPAKSITPVTVSNFERFLRNKKKLNQTTTGMYLTRLRVLTNLGKKRYFVKQDINPFQDCIIPQPMERNIDISIEQFRKLKSYSGKSRIEKIAKDLWFLSFYLGGINLIDLLKIDFSVSGQIEYVRTKTKNTKRGDKRIEISIPTEAKTIIDKYVSKSGMLNFDYNFSYENFNRYVGRTLRKIGKEIGIKRLCYYSARKTFVQYGFELGIPLEVLEYTIGQSMKQNRPIYNYIRIMRKHADEAIAKIIKFTE